jgi:anti-sigma factor RsiW
VKPPLDSELHALVDGRLQGQMLTDVESRLSLNAVDAARVHEWRLQKEALHRAFDNWLERPVPRHIQRAARSTPPWRLGAVAGLAGLIIGGGAGYILHGAALVHAPNQYALQLQSQAAVAHATFSPEVRHPVEVSAAHEAHLVQWLSKRLGHPIAIPRLGDLGFELMGGRLLPAGPSPAAQLMYEKGGTQRLTLYVRPAEGNRTTGFRYVRNGTVSVFYWIDGPFGYALSGTIPPDELRSISESVYHQLAAAAH